MTGEVLLTGFQVRSPRLVCIFLFHLQFPSLDSTFSVLLTAFGFLELFFRSCIVVDVAGENVLKTRAIVSLVYFQWIQILRHPGIPFDWLFVNLFVH